MDLYYFLHTRHPEYIDWQITALFYAALHLVDAYLESHGIKPGENHSARRNLVKQELPLSHESYDTLYKLSIDARYDIGTGLKDADRHTALRCLFQIKEHIAGL